MPSKTRNPLSAPGQGYSRAVDLNESFIVLHEHGGRLVSLAELVGDEDGVVAAALDSASRGAIAERGWDGPGDSGPPGWFSDSNVALERVAADSTAIKAIAQCFEHRFEGPGLADKIAGDLANAAAESPSALDEVQVHGGPLIVPDVGPHLSAMVAAQERAISELEDYTHRVNV
jgi:hypothetical protein